MKKTIVVFPYEGELESETVELFKAVLKKVNDFITEEENKDSTIDFMLESLEIDEDLYIAAVSWLNTSNSQQPVVLLQRKISEIYVNSYNSTLLEAWGANIDVSLVTNAYGCVMYVCSYVTKAERTLGDMLKSVDSSSLHLGKKKSMQNVKKKFLTNREVSAQEAVYRLLGLSFQKGCQVQFVSTDMPENRTRLFKSMSEIDRLEDDDEDIYQNGLIERYPKRPDILEDMCLADFASLYQFTRTSRKKADNVNDLTENADNNTDAPEENPHDPEGLYPQQIQLKDELGYMVKRKTPIVIRSHQFSKTSQAEQYYHAKLFLYYPWRNEDNLKLDGSYQNNFNLLHDKIQPTMNRFEYFSNEVSEAVEDMENGVTDNAWAFLASTSEQQNTDDREEGVVEEMNLMTGYDPNSNELPESSMCQYEINEAVMSPEEYKALILSLNSLQYTVHQHFVDWCMNQLLARRTGKPDQFFLHLTGGGGVGKSHLVTGVVETSNRMLSKTGRKPPHCIVSAPTGAASFHIAGTTIHRAFSIPPGWSSNDDYVALSGEKLAKMREIFESIYLIVIDEVSMVGTDEFLFIHRRLNDIFGLKDDESLFGGLSVLAVGDLLQLPPVLKKAIFDLPNDEMAAKYGSLWQEHFKIIELVEVIRQKEDLNFIRILNDLRIGRLTEDDRALLEENIKSPITDDDYPHGATHIFCYNSQVDAHNETKLLELPQPHYKFTAKDQKIDQRTGHKVYINLSQSKVNGVAKVLTVCVNARVVMNHNDEVSDGLANAATGTVTGFYPDPDVNADPKTYKDKCKYILVKFDNAKVGKTRREQYMNLCPSIGEGSTPIKRIDARMSYGKRRKFWTVRHQFPLSLAWGKTIHKEQGQTEDEIVVCTSGNFMAGQLYTALSRPRSMAGLFLTGKLPEKILVNQRALTEIKRMKREAPFEYKRTSIFQLDFDLNFNIMQFNVNSLNAHKSQFEKDNLVPHFHAALLCETWLKDGDSVPQYDVTHVPLRTDNVAEHRSGGLLMYIHKDYRIVKDLEIIPNVLIQHQMVVISPRLCPGIRICLMNLYVHPKSASTKTLQDLETLFQEIPDGLPVYIGGDFNIDISVKSAVTVKFLKLLAYYGLHVLNRKPTHLKGGSLDHILTNISSASIVVDELNTYYSDHRPVAVSTPMAIFNQMYVWNSAIFILS